MKWYCWILSLLLFSLGCSHGNTHKDSAATDLVKQYYGTKLDLPHDSICNIYGREYGIGALNADYLIVNYVEAKDCTKCHLKLPYWKEINRALDTISNARALAILIIKPDTLDKITDFLDNVNYDYPIVLDSVGKYTALANLNENSVIRTFLIDSLSSIVGIGNPVFNEKVWNLYLSQITGVNETDNTTPVLIKNNKKDLGTISRKGHFELDFLVTNTLDESIDPIQIETGCDCISAICDKIAPHTSGTIHIDYNVENAELGAFHHPIIVRYRNIQRPIIIHLYGYVEDAREFEK